MWVRGLKRDSIEIGRKIRRVAPYVGAWIETKRQIGCCFRAESHPMWVRGLKHFLHIVLANLHVVAPYVGAWIETL